MSYRPGTWEHRVCFWGFLGFVCFVVQCAIVLYELFAGRLSPAVGCTIMLWNILWALTDAGAALRKYGHD